MVSVGRLAARTYLLSAAVCALTIAGVAHAQDELPGPPWILGHRGAAGTLPEHTLEGYQMGIAQVSQAGMCLCKWKYKWAYNMSVMKRGKGRGANAENKGDRASQAPVVSPLFKQYPSEPSKAVKQH